METSYSFLSNILSNENPESEHWPIYWHIMSLMLMIYSDFNNKESNYF